MTADLKSYFLSLDRQVFIKFGFLGLAYVVVIFHFLLPSIETNKRLDIERVGKSSSVQNTLKQAVQVSGLAEESLETELALKQLKGHIATEREVENILSDLSQIARVVDVKLNEVSPVDLSFDRGALYGQYIAESSFQIDLEGGFHNISEFVEKLELYHKLIRVAGLTVLPNPENNRLHQASLSVTIPLQKMDLSK